MKNDDGQFLKRIGWGSVLVVVLFLMLVIVAVKLGYLHVVQDLSAGRGDG